MVAVVIVNKSVLKCNCSTEKIHVKCRGLIFIARNGVTILAKIRLRYIQKVSG